MSKILISIVFVLLACDVPADSIRCGRKLVKQGDTGSVLVKKCGKPVRKFSSKETFNERGRQFRETVSNWVYERNRKKSMIVSIHDGKVVKIRSE